ncbi:MAG: hypothetical protein DMG06_12535 [Acidobacteria bacterium]|nr:MAG: hypothetical protein DMG06_12535 [Acidobacteriota bacterium]
MNIYGEREIWKATLALSKTVGCPPVSPLLKIRGREFMDGNSRSLSVAPLISGRKSVPRVPDYQEG